MSSEELNEPVESTNSDGGTPPVRQQRERLFTQGQEPAAPTEYESLGSVESVPASPVPSYTSARDRADYEPLWVRLSLEYGENAPSVTGAQVVYSSVSQDEPSPGEKAVADSIVELIRKAQQMHTEMSREEDTERVDELAATLENDELTFEKLSEMWAEAPTGASEQHPHSPSSDADTELNRAESNIVEPSRIEQNRLLHRGEGEYSNGLRQPLGESTAKNSTDSSGARLGFENIIDPSREEDIYRRQVLARGATHKDIVQQLVKLTASRPELIAYELGETEVQVYVLCGVDSCGYMNVFELPAPDGENGQSSLAVGEPVEDYVAWLVEHLPVTGAALEETPTIWVPLFGGADELEFLTDGDVAALLDVDIDILTALLLTREERHFAVAPAGSWTLVAGMPDDVLALIDDVQCTALVAEGNENQHHMVLIVPPEDADAPNEVPHDGFASPSQWVQSVLGVPEDAEATILELRWQSVPKQLTRTVGCSNISDVSELVNLLLEMPGMPLASAITRDANERAVEVLTDLFELNQQQQRRLESYVHDATNMLALESVLQLLGLPVELAAVPARRLEVASISTARIFGEEPEPLLSPLDRAYRLVATNRQVRLEEWLDAMATGKIPYDFTHLPPQGNALSQVERKNVRSIFSAAAGGHQHREQKYGVGKPAKSTRGDGLAADAPQSSTQKPADNSFFAGSSSGGRKLHHTSAGSSAHKDAFRTGVFLADGTAQLGLSALFIALARQSRALGRGSNWQTVLASLFALSGTAEILLAPRLARLLNRTLGRSNAQQSKGDKPAPGAVQAEVVRVFNPVATASNSSRILGGTEDGTSVKRPVKRTLIDDLVEGVRVSAVRGHTAKASTAHSGGAGAVSRGGQGTRLGARIRRVGQWFFGR